MIMVSRDSWETSDTNSFSASSAAFIEASALKYLRLFYQPKFEKKMQIGSNFGRFVRKLCCKLRYEIGILQKIASNFM